MNFKEFKTTYQNVPVERYPNKVSNEPLVSVCVQTYQHVDFIKECLDSILLQETDFYFEILLGEDASTDGTRDICIEYAEKNPDKIRLFLHERENNIGIAGQPTGRFNFLYNLFSAKGKYIALCEGDDYWTDPMKLQKQVQFMEKNPEYGFSHTNCSIFYQAEQRIEDNANGKKYINSTFNYGANKRSLFENILLKKYVIRTASAVFRRDLLSKINGYLGNISLKENFPMADIPLWLEMSRITKFHYLKESTMTYRVLAESASKFKDESKKRWFLLRGWEIRLFYISKYPVPFLIKWHVKFMYWKELFANRLRGYQYENYFSSSNSYLFKSSLKLADLKVFKWLFGQYKKAF